MAPALILPERIPSGVLLQKALASRLISIIPELAFLARAGDLPAALSESVPHVRGPTGRDIHERRRRHQIKTRTTP